MEKDLLFLLSIDDENKLIAKKKKIMMKYIMIHVSSLKIIRKNIY